MEGRSAQFEVPETLADGLGKPVVIGSASSGSSGATVDDEAFASCDTTRPTICLGLSVQRPESKYPANHAAIHQGLWPELTAASLPLSLPLPLPIQSGNGKDNGKGNDTVLYLR